MRFSFQVKDSGNYSQIPTRGDLSRTFRPVVIKEAEWIRKKIYWRRILQKFSAKNRVPLKRTSGVGKSPAPDSVFPKGVSGSYTIWAAVGTDGKKSGNFMYTPFILLEEGTQIRYRGMSKNWRSKTTPGSLKVGARHGFAAGWGFYPGIEARNWRDVIVDKEIYPFEQECIKAFQTMANQMRWQTT